MAIDQQHIAYILCGERWARTRDAETTSPTHSRYTKHVDKHYNMQCLTFMN